MDILKTGLIMGGDVPFPWYWTTTSWASSMGFTRWGPCWQLMSPGPVPMVFWLPWHRCCCSTSFTAPRYTFQADGRIYPFTFAAMLVCALITSSMAAGLKREAEKSEAESGYMQILFGINRNLRKEPPVKRYSGYMREGWYRAY